MADRKQRKISGRKEYGMILKNMARPLYSYPKTENDYNPHGDINKRGKMLPR
jgi:hypothetical protein